MAGPAFDTDKKFRSDFRPERERLAAMEKDAKVLDLALGEMIAKLSVDAARGRGAGGLLVRMTEQLLGNRNHRLQVVREMRSLRRDVVDREIRLGALQQEAGVAEAVAGASAALLRMLQGSLLGPACVTLEPGEYGALDADEEIRQRLGTPAPEVHAIPDDVREGDTVSDSRGRLWVLGPDGLEEAGGEAEEVVLDPPEGVPPHARLQGGELVLVVNVEA